jgi:hypothetical protein
MRRDELLEALKSANEKLTASEAKTQELQTELSASKDELIASNKAIEAQEMEIEILKSIDVFCASGMTQIQFADKKWCINQGETWRPQLTKESKK